MFIIVSFAKFVTTYTSKPKKNKKKAAAPASATAAPATDEPPRSDFSEKDAD